MLKGLSRRPITDDVPDLAICVATLLKLAANSTERLDQTIPLMRVQYNTWQSSGLLETAQQCKDFHKVDYRPGMQNPRKRKRTGPCIFGCEPKATLSQNGSVQWYGVADPSPWPGIQPGETICKRCYTWARAVSSKRRRPLQPPASQLPRHPMAVDKGVRLHGLAARPELNGQMAQVAVPINDDGRITVRIQPTQELVRVRAERLQEFVRGVHREIPARVPAG